MTAKKPLYTLQDANIVDWVSEYAFIMGVTKTRVVKTAMETFIKRNNSKLEKKKTTKKGDVYSAITG